MGKLPYQARIYITHPLVINFPSPVKGRIVRMVIV